MEEKSISGYKTLFFDLCLLGLFVVYGACYSIYTTQKRVEFAANKRFMISFSERVFEYYNAKKCLPENIDILSNDLSYKRSFLDAWRTMFVYKKEKCSGEKFIVISAGKDKRFDTEDDVIMNVAIAKEPPLNDKEIMLYDFTHK